MAVNRELKELLSRIKFFKGVNQKDIALALSVKPTYLSDVVNGRVPFSDNLRKKLHELYTDCLQEKGMTGADILDKLLNYTGLNVNQFSEKIGLQRPQALYDIQKGKTRSISANMASRIVSVFPVISKSWLLTGEGEMLKNSLHKPDESSTSHDWKNNNVFNEGEAWEVIRNQAASLKERDDMISRMISISERSLVQVERAMAHYDKLFSALSGDFVAYNPYAGRREGKNPPPIKSGKK